MSRDAHRNGDCGPRCQICLDDAEVWMDAPDDANVGDALLEEGDE